MSTIASNTIIQSRFCADTTPYSPEEKQKQYERSVLFSTPLNKSINLRHRESREEVDGLKVDVDEIFISSGGSREFLTKNQVLLQYEVLPSKLILSEQDRARISRKKRQDRQQHQLELERKAKTTAKDHRLALLRDEFRSCIGNNISNETILHLIELCQSNYTEVVHVIDTETGTKSKFDVSFTAYDVHASSIVAKRTIIESLTKNRKEHNMFKTKRLVFSTKRGG